MKMEREMITKVQESKGKFMTSIPIGLIKLAGINKSDTFIWNLYDGNIAVTIIKKRTK
jgi:hypothetical protein